MPPRTFVPLFVALTALLLSASCGAAPMPRTSDERPHELGEARALEVIEATLTRLGVRPASGWEVDIGAAARLRVDVRLGTGNFGIDYVTAQDRADTAELPPPPRTRQLQLLPGANDDAQTQVLLLDERWYTFDPHVEHVQAGQLSAQDAEGRLERDVSDFVEYVRGQNGL